MWYTDPPGVVLQLAAPIRGNVEMAEWLCGPGVERLRVRYPNVKGLVLVMDLTLMDGREPDARAVMLRNAAEMRGLFAKVFVVPPAKANRIYLSTLHAAAAVLSAFGVKLSIERSLTMVFARCPLKAGSH